jgi:Domain of unknown function (DUF4062)
VTRSHVRHQIFVSSTYKDLLEERQAAVEAILRAGHIPAGMELFAAQNKPQMDVIKEWIEESDIFCLILGARYGSIEPESGKSYVECEYDHAVKLGKPIFSLVLEDGATDAKVKERGHRGIIEQDNQPLLRVFRSRVTSTLVRMVTTPDSIKVAIFEAISALGRRHEIEGWIRAKDASVSPKMGEELARLSAENARLTKELAAATIVREEMIDGRSLKEWMFLLGQYSFPDWNPVANEDSGTTISLSDAFLRYGHALGAGVSSAASDSSFSRWLFGIFSALASLGLAEIKKSPAGVYWQRLGLSTAGKRLYVALVAQTAQGQGLATGTELMRELLDALESPEASSPTGAAAKTKREPPPPVSGEAPLDIVATKKSPKKPRPPAR